VHSRLVTAKDLGLDEGSAFAELLGSNSSAFLSDKQGLIGWGEALRLEATGPNRILDLDTQWRELVSNAEVTNEVNLSGSGLICFGSIAFSDKSPSTSVLVIPKVIVGKHADKLWLTTVNIDEVSALDLISFDSTFTSATFEPGQITPDQYILNVERAVAEIASKKIEKVVLNIGATADALEKGVKLLRIITGKNPAKMKSNKRIPVWSVRPNLAVGTVVTIRKNTSDFLKRLNDIIKLIHGLFFKFSVLNLVNFNII
jgi:isochorismate synthase EntC